MGNNVADVVPYVPAPQVPTPYLVVVTASFSCQAYVAFQTPGTYLSHNIWVKRSPLSISKRTIFSDVGYCIKSANAIFTPYCLIYQPC